VDKAVDVSPNKDYFFQLLHHVVTCGLHSGMLVFYGAAGKIAAIIRVAVLSATPDFA